MPALLDLLRQPFQRHARTLRQLCLALLHLAVLRDALGLVAVPPSPGTYPRHPASLQVRDLNRRRRPGLLDLPSTIVEHRANLAERIANDIAVAVAQRTVLHQNARDCTATAIQLRFDDRTHCRDDPAAPSVKQYPPLEGMISSSSSSPIRFFADTSTNSVSPP